MTNHPPSVLWHCWLGHQTCKNHRPYNLYCVGADCSRKTMLNQSINLSSLWLLWFSRKNFVLLLETSSY